ncbi:hypothetical protein, partial [Campylobacter jejuni]|uniref:hypothetical protein n=1 Tax=Campylobacter jejuni TaxID=197 RepID=UPI00196AFEA1
ELINALKVVGREREKDKMAKGRKRGKQEREAKKRGQKEKKTGKGQEGRKKGEEGRTREGKERREGRVDGLISQLLMEEVKERS